MLGAKRIIGIDYVPQRLQVAQEMLGIETINVKEYEITKTLVGMVPDGVHYSLQSSDSKYNKSLFFKNECSLQSSINVDMLTEIVTCVSVNRCNIVAANFLFILSFSLGCSMCGSICSTYTCASVLL